MVRLSCEKGAVSAFRRVGVALLVGRDDVFEGAGHGRTRPCRPWITSVGHGQAATMTRMMTSRRLDRSSSAGLLYHSGHHRLDWSQ
ncbi:hypothetical protein [Azospirillum doebereinerae]